MMIPCRETFQRTPYPVGFATLNLRLLMEDALRATPAIPEAGWRWAPFRALLQLRDAFAERKQLHHWTL
ncbi:MAG: hypothetical protein DBY35_09250 [Bacteroidales bacterium]|nr:MAG: hypothetical protein DBY35_09250 [Bacteroidales bacterium]